MITIEDKNNIIDIIPLCQNGIITVNPDKIREAIARQSEISDIDWELRKTIMALEGESKEISNTLSNLAPYYKIVYATQELEDINEECNTVISNSSDYRNKVL